MRRRLLLLVTYIVVMLVMPMTAYEQNESDDGADWTTLATCTVETVMHDIDDYGE